MTMTNGERAVWAAAFMYEWAFIMKQAMEDGTVVDSSGSSYTHSAAFARIMVETLRGIALNPLRTNADIDMLRDMLGTMTVDPLKFSDDPPPTEQPMEYCVAEVKP